VTKELSAYLNVLRILAALTVFLGHLSGRSVSGGFLWQIQPYGHSAVIVFFVLSGFVIRYSVDEKEKTLLDYSVARFARLYSVVLPALALTLVCDLIGTSHNPNVYDMARETNAPLRLAQGVLFLTQSWQRVSLLSNEPFWSLPYEFWYYVIFATAIFLRRWPRLIAIIIVSLVGGPAILLLFPIWLMGVASYRITKALSLTKLHAVTVWWLSALGVVATVLLHTPVVALETMLLPPSFSVLDYLLGALLAINFVAASRIDFGLTRMSDLIGYFAGMTFALYLFHLPLLHLAAAYVAHHLPVPIKGMIEFTFVLSVVFALSFITENQKKRWQDIFRKLFGLFALARVRPAGMGG